MRRPRLPLGSVWPRHRPGLHVAVEPVGVVGHPLDRGHRVHHPELRDDADPDGDLVRRQDLLTLDGQLTLAQVDQDDLDEGAAAERNPAGEAVPARLEDNVEPTIDVAQTPVGAADDHLTAHGGSPPWRWAGSALERIRWEASVAVMTMDKRGLSASASTVEAPSSEAARAGL